MTREEAARRYLQASRAASVFPAGHEGRQAHEDTMAQLAKRHPHVRMHAIVGAGEDFDQPLDRNEREHQAQLRRDSGLTNEQVTARRRELRANHYGFPTPSEIYDESNPAPEGGQRARARRTTSARRGGRRARTTLRQVTPGPVKSAGAIAGELLMAGLALSLLYLLLTSEEKGGTHVFSSILTGVSGALRRLTDPKNNLFSPAAATSTARTVAAPSGTGGGAPLAGHLAKRLPTPHGPAAKRSPTLFGPLPSYSTVTPTIP